VCFEGEILFMLMRTMFLGVADGDDEVSEKSAPSPSHPPATITNIQHNTKKTLGTRTIEKKGGLNVVEV
jgi:hypothetical protein